jgi:hypothetical protein
MPEALMIAQIVRVSACGSAGVRTTTCDSTRLTMLPSQAFFYRPHISSSPITRESTRRQTLSDVITWGVVSGPFEQVPCNYHGGGGHHRNNFPRGGGMFKQVGHNSCPLGICHLATKKIVHTFKSPHPTTHHLTSLLGPAGGSTLCLHAASGSCFAKHSRATYRSRPRVL